MAQINHNISNPNDNLGDQLRTSFGNQNAMNTELYTTKLDKVTGKGLTENEFTNAEKAKLAAIAAGAEVNVQADWEQEDSTADDYIKNKPVDFGIPPVPTLEEVTNAGNTSNRQIIVNAGIEENAINANSTDGFGVFAYSQNLDGVVGRSDQRYGVYGGSNNSVAGVFDIEMSNTSNIAEFQKNGINQAYITHDGKVNATQFRLSALNTAPATATSTGTLGEIRVTASHIYVCTSTNVWVRNALTTW